MWRLIISRSFASKRFFTNSVQTKQIRHKNDIFETNKPTISHKTESTIQDLIKLRQDLLSSIKLIDEKIDNPKSIKHLEDTLLPNYISAQSMDLRNMKELLAQTPEEKSKADHDINIKFFAIVLLMMFAMFGSGGSHCPPD